MKGLPLQRQRYKQHEKQQVKGFYEKEEEKDMDISHLYLPQISETPRNGMPLTISLKYNSMREEEAEVGSSDFSKGPMMMPQFMQQKVSAPMMCPSPSSVKMKNDCQIIDSTRYEGATWEMFYRISNARSRAMRQRQVRNGFQGESVMRMPTQLDRDRYRLSKHCVSSDECDSFLEYDVSSTIYESDSDECDEMFVLDL